jgi:hypothetical protein
VEPEVPSAPVVEEKDALAVKVKCLAVEVEVEDGPNDEDEGRIAKRLAELALLEQAYIRDDKVLVKEHVKPEVITPESDIRGIIAAQTAAKAIAKLAGGLTAAQVKEHVKEAIAKVGCDDVEAGVDEFAHHHPGVARLNNGSFGSAPRRVLDAQKDVEDALDGGVAVVVEGVAAVVEGVAGRVGGEVETEAAPAFEEKAARELAEAEARAAAEDARRAAQLAAQLEAESKRLALEESRASALAAKAQERAEAAAASVGGLSSKAKELGGFGSFVSKLGTVKGGEPRESRRAKSDAELASVSAAVESASQQSVPKPSPNIPAE